MEKRDRQFKARYIAKPQLSDENRIYIFTVDYPDADIERKTSIIELFLLFGLFLNGRRNLVFVLVHSLFLCRRVFVAIRDLCAVFGLIAAGISLRFRCRSREEISIAFGLRDCSERKQADQSHRHLQK